MEYIFAILIIILPIISFIILGLTLCFHCISIYFSKPKLNKRNYNYEKTKLLFILRIKHSKNSFIRLIRRIKTVF